MLIQSIFDVMVYVIIDLNYSVIFFIFSPSSCLLASIAACMIHKCSSDFLYILFPPFGILKLEV